MQQIDDPDVLKVLTSRFRMRLFSLLFQIGPVTVSELARRMNADPGQVSYHLRQLQKHDLIEDVPELARDSRERWVRPAMGGLVVDRDFEAPEARAALQAWTSQWVIDQFERLRDFKRTHMTLPEDWRNAGFGSSRHLRLTKDELAQLADQLNAVLQPWRELTKSRVESSEAPPDTRPIFIFYHAFPEEP
ncbi:ArsR/SmtB family transcription factor [Nonomuraea jiangxiensis]|uniref:Helix-turn-helix domain-containing protein n=1 Tax=Nonomuraea jiangxiensis TaxID=633440 RepID=A0A1G9C964_9ACTN|nr:helix-turn-helix domain-containing protein [Nonomuraea jiangxiensis]SDK48189.1 Helix-turn-helix domain-containing protein [Nonomuraea jiangxiensis]